MLDLLKTEDYKFINDDPRLKDNIILLTYGGSHAYGTNVETSDIDIRGIAFNPIKDILDGSWKTKDQFEDNNTDTTIYYLNKMIRLLLENNPNTIEILGCKPEHYFILSDDGKRLIENRKMFLSRRCFYTFGHYANSQLRRLQNVLARDSYSQSEKENHILGSITHAMDDILMRYHKIDGEVINYSFDKNEDKFKNALISYNKNMRLMENNFSRFEYGSISLYPDFSDRDDMDVEIFCDVVLHHYPIRDYANIWNELNSIVKDYDKLGKRNKKKDDLHLNKHAMHLVRLFLMCIDILEKEEIITYREKNHNLLMSIRNGDFQREDKTYRPEFFEMVDELQKKMERAAANTALPQLPDANGVYEMLYDMNKRHIILNS